MADNVIRQDVVQIGFDIDNNPLLKLSKEIEEIKKMLKGGIGDDAIDDLKDSTEECVKPLKKVKEEAEKVKDKIVDIGKKAATTAFNGLKKLAGISFRAITVGIGAAATAVGGLVAKSVSAYAEFEQLKGGVETLFGAKGAKSVEEYAKTMNKSVGEVKGEYEKLKKVEETVIGYSNNAFKTSGLSANDYMSTVTSFSASLISSVGGDTEKAANLANMAIVDMSDNANKMGTDMGSIQYAYQGFAKQNYTMLDNLKLGYGGTKTEMQRLIKDASKMKDVQKKLGVTIDANSMSYGNIVKAIHVVQEQMYINGTTQKEAEGTITGSLNMVKAAWGNLMPALIQGGDTFDQCIENLVYSVDKFSDNIIPAMEKALGGIGTLIEKLAPKFAEKFPALAEKLIPPLLKAAVEIVKGLVKALPTIIKTVFDTIVDICGDQFPILKKLSGVFSDNAKTIAKLIPVIIGLVAAFKGFNKIKSIFSIFGGGDDGGKGKRKKKGGLFGGLIKTLKDLSKVKPTVILKGMANLAIILGGFAVLIAAFMAVAPYMAKLSDAKSLIEVISVVAALGLVGTALAKFAGIVGKIPVSTVALGLANMAIMLAGMSALFLLVGALTLIKFDYGKMLQVSALIGVLGTIGAALSIFGGIVGLIPVPVVALGLANMAIILVGVGALLWTLTKVFDKGVKFTELLQTITLIGILGTVGTVLSVFAGIVGIIPIPIVLAGLANMALVLGGITGIIVAFGKLSEIKGFTEFLSKGGETLSKIFGIIGECAGSLIGGLGKGISNALPAIGENLGKFGENVKPLFDNMKDVDMGGVGAFFTSLIGLLGMATGNEIIEGIKSFFGKDGESSLAKLGTELSNFATNAEGFFNKVATFKPEAFTNATEMFKSLAEIKGLPKANKDGKTAISAIANDLSTFDEKTSGFFTAVKDYDLAKVNELWNSLKNADDVTKNISAKVNGELDAIVAKVGELPKQMGDAITKGGESLSTALVEIWKDAVTATAKPVNKLIEGANWVLKEFGSKKQIISWTPYAGGTGGHKGGNALVNDGRGAELIQMPNGRTFIPNGRNVFLPNAPKGMKVLPAESTAQLMGKRSPTFRYADGTGKIDIWSYFDNGKGLVNAVSNKYVNYKGVSGLALHIGKGVVNTVTGEMSAWADKLFEEFGAMSLEAYNPSRGVEQWRSTVMRALKMEGLYSEANVKRTLMQMQTESGGNPRAINLWDSNAKKGIPSKGLMQVIDPTFRAYARAGFNKNIYDPLSNILASVRYATSRYGSLAKAYRGVGYSNGIGEVKFPEQSRVVSMNYTPESNISGGRAVVTEHNSYAPQFNLTIQGGDNDRSMERKVKRWINEAMDEIFDSMARKSPRVREV